MKHLNKTGVIHFVNNSHIENLKSIFAKLTPDGWVIPNWLIYLESTKQS